MWSDEVKSAFEKAKKTRENAYAVYSQFQVGASVKVKGEDSIFTGCNIENSSFGATICAERVAMFKAVSEHGKIDIEFLVLVTDVEDVTPPCALCLQVMSEFSGPETEVYLGNLSGLKKKYKFCELLPQPFDKKDLPGF